jgi:hypothetical protein
VINPWAILGVILLVTGVYYEGHHRGYEERVLEDQAEISRLNDEARSKEQQVTEKFASLNSQLTKAKNEIKEKQFSIDQRIDSGELRLPSNCPIHASSDTASGDGDKGSESDKQVIKDIVTIATDGDSAIEELNTCIRKYEEVRMSFNKVKK